MCNQFTFHHQFGIDTGRSKFEQQTDSTPPARGSHGQKTMRILTRSTWKHRVLHNTCMKNGRNIRIRVLGRHQLCSEERIEVPSIMIPAHCIPKVVRMETGEVINEKVFASPPLPPKISLKHDWMKELGFRSCSTTRRRSCPTCKRF